MTSQRRVYYAASLFNEAEREFNLKVVSMIHDLGLSTWFPQEDVGLLSDFIEEDGMSLIEAREHIFRLNIAAVKEADVVVFVLDGRGPDEGACIEAGIAWGMHKRVIALKTDFRDGEHGGNNLMIDGIVTDVAGSIDELRHLLSIETIVDLTGTEPVVTVRHREPEAVPESVEIIPES
ncbi:MAG: nucleoside 2-deoxyribosyltransferase [Acidimicrobiia bacterium]|nr:nucleoside 2-deoxyribosyltransferase [Acidimicrobiia bacterium]MDX2465956.1 nucleoside 2-deoxyribosyltransferase [Acidimicrobiia bacterium]